jgi:hypothetical protein
MRQLLLTICLSTLLFPFISFTQSGCPGCLVNVPSGFPADTIFLPDLPDGEKGTTYQQDVSFRLPKTTTPVNAIDSTTPPGLTITKFEILSVEGLPAGLYWQLNQTEFDPATQTDGCIRICGTPLESDSFELTVTLKATVFIISQVSTFPMSLYIAPKTSISDGFSMTNPSGCGSTTVEFVNLVPSNGNEGFSYTWDFGDGTPIFPEEDPAPHTYEQPGVYEVGYQAIVDTAGYLLESIQVQDIDCTDPPFYGSPDLYLEIKNPQGDIIFSSSPAVNDAPLPYTFPVNLKLNPGNYNLQVWDNDGGIKGGDDDCGKLTFNILSNGSLVAGGLTVVMNILHQVDTIRSVDTVTVYPQPADPTINAPMGLSVCEGQDGPNLVSSYGFGNQWLLEGALIPGATDFLYQPVISGSYQVQYVSSFGCVATSQPVEVVFNPLPPAPVWFNYNNSLRMTDTTNLPAQYSLQWYKNGVAIPGETDFWYCSTTSGAYMLEITDLSTGCSSTHSAQVTNNPNYNCLTGTNAPYHQPFTVSPNPSTGLINMEFPAMLTRGAIIRLTDMNGRLVQTEILENPADTVQWSSEQLSPGVYIIEVLSESFRGMARIVRM